MFDPFGIFESLSRAVTFTRAGAFVAMAALIVLAAALLFRLARRRRRRRWPMSQADDDTEKASIDAFLASRRVALVGASHDPAHFSRLVMRELLDHGVDVIPIHPTAKSIDGRRAYAHVREVADFVNGALIMTPAEKSAEVVEECGRAGIKRVWLHRGAGAGSVSEQAIRTAHRHELVLVAGRCPLMFLTPPSSFIHRAHAAMVRLSGRYPKSGSKQGGH